MLIKSFAFSHIGDASAFVEQVAQQAKMGVLLAGPTIHVILHDPSPLVELIGIRCNGKTELYDDEIGGFTPIVPGDFLQAREQEATDLAALADSADRPGAGELIRQYAEGYSAACAEIRRLRATT